MKMFANKVLILGVLGCIFQLVLMNATPDQVMKELTKDPKLTNLSAEFGKLAGHVQQLDKSFEVDMLKQNEHEMHRLVDQIIPIREQARHLLMDIRIELASAFPRRLFHRLFLESLRVQIEHYDKLLKQMGLELLGGISGFAAFESYAYSETVSIAKQLLLAKFANMMSSSFEADQLIQHAGLSINQETKLKIDAHFQHVLSNATAAKNEIARDYYEEIERIRLDGKELNLMQKKDFEMTIDLLNFGSGFIKKYEELFLRINA